MVKVPRCWDCDQLEYIVPDMQLIGKCKEARIVVGLQYEKENKCVPQRRKSPVWCLKRNSNKAAADAGKGE